MGHSLPNRDEITPDTPLRLSVAAAIAFPDGSMTASGLRREAGRNNLIIERIAGKDYTTLTNIELMRERCRVKAKVPGSGSESAATGLPSGSSSTADAKSAQARARTISAQLKEH